VSDHLVYWIGDRDPPVSDTITIDGGPVDLSAKTVTFKMRAVGSSTLKVNQPVSFKDANGNWRYDWAVNDLDIAASYLVWVEVLSGAKPQTMWESVIEVRAHSPLANTYVELEELKSTGEFTNTTLADWDAQVALESASRTVDLLCGQRFYPDPDATSVRYYTANGDDTLRIDPLITLTSLATDASDDGTYESTWVLSTDFVLEPRNALADGVPYDSIRKLLGGSYAWPAYADSVKITGRFGWLTPPAGVKIATTNIAIRLVNLMRQAPFGVAGIGADGTAVRIARDMPDVMRALAPYVRRTLLV
jgi:hypothetical protein